jgi:hypothetical protein
MSFKRNFNAERLRLAPLFAAAVEADKTFHEAWNAGVAEIGWERYKKTDRYSQTLSCFSAARRAIDQKVSDALANAKRGDLTQLPLLVAYLEMPGRYFRSGYQRTDVWRLLKRISLDDEQSAILRRIILDQIGTAGPEFQEAAKVAPGVSSPDFCRDVERLCDSDRDYVSSRAEQLLTRIESAAT